MRTVPLLTYRAFAAPAIMALAIACGLMLSRLAPDAPGGPSLEWLDAPRPVANFQLLSNESAFTANTLRGRWQFLVLGFTHCPDLCPTTLSQLTALRAALPDSRLRIVFVSVDAERDTPRRLSGYVGYFGEDVLGVTGSDDELRRLAHSLGMDFRREGAVETRTISHSPTIAIIGPDGTLRGRLRPGFDTQQVARDIAARIGASS
jgi:protein SCO1/2